MTVIKNQNVFYIIKNKHIYQNLTVVCVCAHAHVQVFSIGMCTHFLCFKTCLKTISLNHDDEIS